MRKVTFGLTALVLCSAIATHAQQRVSKARAHVLVYKAKAQYRNKVAVQLSPDRKTVVAYPDPADVRAGGSKMLPVALHKGYWLDNMGVGPNTAFISMTYEQYGKLVRPLSPEELNKMVLDRNAVTDVCDCGVRETGKYSVKQLNQMIDKGTLTKNCKPVK